MTERSLSVPVGSAAARGRGAPDAAAADPSGPVEGAAALRLVTAVQDLSLARDLETVMAIVRRAARELTGADGATLVLRDGDFCHYADEEAIGPLWKGQRFPMSTCISGWVMENRRPAVIEDVYADPRIPAEAYRPTFVRSLAMVPIRTADPVGAIGNYWAARRRPTPAEVGLLGALADSASVAMENVRLYAELERRVRDRTAELEAANRRLRDETRERRRADEEVRRLNAELEERVRRRTLELSQSNEDLRRYAYVASHDLKEPLRMVTSFAQMLAARYRGRLDAEADEFIGYVVEGVARMHDMLDGLLRLASLDAKQADLRPVSAEEALRRALADLRLAVRECGAQVTHDPLPRVVADAAQLAQLFQNLLGNALKFRKGHGPRIHVHAAATPDSFRFSVEDDGIGFDPSHAEQIFAIYRRLHGRGDYPGIGLGLAICRKIVERHRGRIWADSEPGRGSTFHFTLPVDGDAGATDALPPATR